LNGRGEVGTGPVPGIVVSLWDTPARSAAVHIGHWVDTLTPSAPVSETLPELQAAMATNIAREEVRDACQPRADAVMAAVSDLETGGAASETVTAVLSEIRNAAARRDDAITNLSVAIVEKLVELEGDTVAVVESLREYCESAWTRLACCCFVLVIPVVSSTVHLCGRSTSAM
jgi:hypothetical protein